MKKKAILEVLLLIIISFSPLISQAIKSIILGVIVLLNIKYLKSFNKLLFMILFLFLSIFLINIIYDFGNIQSIENFNLLMLYFPLCIMYGVTIAKKYSLEEYLIYAEKIIFILSLFSLIGVFIYTFLPNLVSYLLTYNYYHTSHKTAVIFNILIGYNGEVVTRNAGVAWEPGAFQILVNLGLYTQIRFINSSNFYKIVIYVITIISTASTAGLAIMLIILIFLLKKQLLTTLIFVFTIIIFRDYVILEALYHIENKLFGSSSFEIRSEPFLDAISVANNNILGLGNSGYDMYYRPYNTPSWDAIGQILLRYGYSLLFVLLFCLAVLAKHHLILTLIILLTLFTQNIWFFPFIVPFYFFMLNKTSLINNCNLKFQKAI